MLPIRSMLVICIVAVVTSATAAFAQNPFLGTWKQNNDKSKFTGDIVEFSAGPEGGIKYTAEGRSYTFKTDGKQYTSVVRRN
jgi:hypothetical protein